MGNHHSQTLELNPDPTWSHSFPREKQKKLLKCGAIQEATSARKVLPVRVPGQKLRLTANGSILHQGGTISGRRLSAAHSFRPLPDAQPSSLQPTMERDIGLVNHNCGGEPHQKGYDSEPDLRDVIVDGIEADGEHQARTLTRESGDKSRARSRKKSRAPPPPGEESLLAPSPDVYPPPVPDETHSKAVDDVASEQPKRRLFKRHKEGRRRTGSRAPVGGRAASEERWEPAQQEMQERQSRAQSIECIRARAMTASELASSFASLPRTQSSQITSLIEPEQAREMAPLMRQKNGGGQLSKTRPCSISETALNIPANRELSERRLHQAISTEDHRITITVSSGQSSDGDKKEHKPSVFFFGMEPDTAEKKDGEDGAGKTSALAKVKRNNEHVSINGSSVSYRKRTLSTGRSKGSAPASADTPVSGGDTKSTNGVSRIPSRKLQDFVSSLERNRQKQLSVSRDEIISNSSALSCKSQSSVFDLEMDATGDESISMHLRPTLPRKQLEVPRFSPLSAWRSLNLDQVASRQRPWRDVSRCESVGTSDVSEEPSPPQSEQRIRRCRPMTKSADSGISGDVSSQPPPMKLASSAEPPLAASTPTPVRDVGWVPAQDLDISSGGEEPGAAAAGTQTEAAGTPPKLMSRGDMFTTADAAGGTSVTSGKTRSERGPSSHTFNSLRQMKRSVSTAINALTRSPAHSIDENWFLSRSVPTSLNGGDDDAVSRPVDVRSDGGGTASEKHVLYLPEYNPVKAERGRSPSVTSASVLASTGSLDWKHEQPRNDEKKVERRATPEKPPRTSLAGGSRGNKKFSYQSTVRLMEKKQLEARLNRLAEMEEQQRLKEQRLLQQVEQEFQRKRNNEQSELKLKQQQQRKGNAADFRDQIRVQNKPSEGLLATIASGPRSPTELDTTQPERSRSDIHRPGPQPPMSSGCYPHDDHFRSGVHRTEPDHGPTSLQIPVSGGRVSPQHSFRRIPYPPPDYNSLPPLSSGPQARAAPNSPTRLSKSRDKTNFLSGVRNWIRSRKDVSRLEDGATAHGTREEPEGAPAAVPSSQHDGYRQDVISTPRRSNSRPPEKRKSIYKQVAEFTEDVSDLSGVSSPVSELAAASLSGSTQRQHSSGYESSPNCEHAARLTQELSEYRQGTREYREYRPPAEPAPTPQAARARESANTRSAPFAEAFGPSRHGRSTPASIYSESRTPASNAAGRQGKSSAAPGDPLSESQSLAAAHIHSNYRREFALGAASPTASGAASLDPTHLARGEARTWDAREPRESRDRDFVHVSDRRKCNGRSPRRNESFQRSLRPQGPSSVEAVTSAVVASARHSSGRPPPQPPGLFQPHPIFGDHRGACSSHVNSSPARFLYGPESFGAGHRPAYNHAVPPSV